MSLSSLALILFIIIDPLGKISFVSRLLSQMENRRSILIRELVLALAFMLGFNFIGETLFSVLSLSHTNVVISSGLILFLVSLRILFPRPDFQEVEPSKDDPVLVPLAIPSFASPALLATIMIFAQTVPDQSTTVLAILIAWAIAGVFHLLGEQIQRVMGTGGMLASERMMAMILMMLSIQRMSDGVRLLVEGL